MNKRYKLKLIISLLIFILIFSIVTFLIFKNWQSIKNDPKSKIFLGMYYISCGIYIGLMLGLKIGYLKTINKEKI